MHVSDDKFQSFAKEAEVNYANGRFSDAAATFTYLIRLSMQQQQFTEAVHFYYRVLDCYDHLQITQKIVQTWRELGIYALKIAGKMGAESVQKEYDFTIKAQLLENLQQTMLHLKMDKERKIVLEQLFQIYLNLSDEHDAELQMKITYAEKMLQLTEVLTEHRRAIIYNRLADLYYELMLYYKKNQSLDNSARIKRTLAEANKYCTKLGKTPFEHI